MRRGRKPAILHDLFTSFPVKVLSQKILASEIRFEEQRFQSWSNIAEGFERDGTGEFIQFLAIAKGSSAEVLSHAYVALDQGFITKKDFDDLVAKTSEVGRMIAALMAYLRKSGTKGLNFKV